MFSNQNNLKLRKYIYLLFYTGIFNNKKFNNKFTSAYNNIFFAKF